jgi:hypothetical protein
VRLNRLALLAAAPLVLLACSSSTGDGGGASGDAATAEAPVASNPNAPDAPQTPQQTDQGCGGLNAPPCDDGKKCNVGKDCKSEWCQAGICTTPTPTDGVKNGDETDVDCGGAASPTCADGKACIDGANCASGVCTGNVCQAPAPNDGVKNGDETDVDCGGAAAPTCADGKACGSPGDCASGVCTGNVCQVPTGTDGVKNGDESDTDCGGTTTGAPKCAVGKSCSVHADCASDGCGYDKKCALRRSCTQHLGGDTCGSGEIGEAGAAHESCCATAPIAGSTAKIDKYLVTAGRMRAFMERLNGDVKTYANGLGYSAAQKALVPGDLAEVDQMMGSYWFNAPNDSDVATNAWSKRSCAPGSFGGHTYWTPANGSDFSSFTKDQLDPKALNCVGWHIANAFCKWDGGRLATLAEITSAFTNGGTVSWPWGNAAYNSTVQDARVNHVFNYGYPGNAPMNGGTVRDIAWYISPPGRFPLGNNANGVADASGDLLVWISNAEYDFTWTQSWENHGKSLVAQSWKTAWPGEPNGYYAIGIRCAHD